jgi:hypothetical protein
VLKHRHWTNIMIMSQWSPQRAYAMDVEEGGSDAGGVAA